MEATIWRYSCFSTTHCFIEHTLENQEAAVSHAAYHALVAQFPDYEEASGHFLTMLKSLGHEPAQEASGSSPATLGALAAWPPAAWGSSPGC